MLHFFGVFFACVEALLVVLVVHCLFSASAADVVFVGVFVDCLCVVVC